jgi:LysM repeat protein
MVTIRYRIAAAAALGVVAAGIPAGAALADDPGSSPTPPTPSPKGWSWTVTTPTTVSPTPTVGTPTAASAPWNVTTPTTTGAAPKMHFSPPVLPAAPTPLQKVAAAHLPSPKVAQRPVRTSPTVTKVTAPTPAPAPSGLRRAVGKVFTTHPEMRTKNTALWYVAPGETLTSIARANRTTWQHLQRLNKIENPDLIIAGTHILVPKV